MRTKSHTPREGGERGVSLVEATIILAVVATLATILAPGINGFVDQARQARTRTDLSTIAEAIQQFITDTGEHQMLIDASNGATDGTPPTRGDTNRVDLLVSDGDIPVLSTAMAAEQLWVQPVDNGIVDTLANHLVENSPADDTSKRYRTGSDVTIAAAGGQNIDFARVASGGFNAPHSWRGPYLRGPVGGDPWGNRYAVNVLFLDPAPSSTSASYGDSANFALNGARSDVFVLSPGPDEEIDTLVAQDGAVPGDDDYIHVVSSHAK